MCSRATHALEVYCAQYVEVQGTLNRGTSLLTASWISSQAHVNAGAARVRVACRDSCDCLLATCDIAGA